MGYVLQSEVSGEEVDWCPLSSEALMCKCSLNEHDKAHAVTYCGRSQPQLMAVCVVPLEAAM